jgi:GT2 family glycosyltransferase
VKLSIVIPSWNTRELLRACLASLRRAALPEHETIVIDNASADGSADMVAAEFPEVVLQRNARNEGFAIGCNQGLRRASGEFLFLLNADTEVAADAVQRMLAFLAAHARHGAIAPRLVSADGSTQRTCLCFPNLWTPLCFGGPLERWFPDNFELRRYFMRDWDQQSSRDVDQPPAAALIVRRAALDEVGLFDEALWLFYNDVDLSKRLIAAGWKTHYLAEATVLHHIGASTKQFGNFLPEWHKNRLHYFRKHHGRLAGAWVKLCTGLAALDWTLVMLLRRVRGRPSEPCAPLWQKYWSYVRL